ncbi:hypothetical protein RUM44_008263 [Polyplax serrata]|uniref:FYVE-type domain-containing protein n=1 Tax=Polyplax serrata TaxID=468196 RepID=A0ABR1BBS9_POLSC
MSNPIEMDNTKTKLNNEVTDNDTHLQLQHLQAKVSDLEKEKKEIQDNFNAQRARLQKLYIQKEEELTNVTSDHVRLEGEIEKLTKELDEAKSQLCIAGIVKENEVEAEKRKAQAEIAALNQIVQDTVEVSSTSQSEVKKLKQVIQLLESQLSKLRGEREKEGLLLAPSNMLSGAKTLARKVVGQLGNDSDYRVHDNLEDSMKKAQEDTEVLKALVIPLEEKIQELTNKLWAAEQRIKKYEPEYVAFSVFEKKKLENNTNDLFLNTSQESGTHSPIKSNSKHLSEEQREIAHLDGVPEGISSLGSSVKSGSCDMCSNYEAQLVSQQKLNAALQKEKEKIETNMERLKDDINRETQFRKTMEDKWNEKKEKHKAKVAELKSMYKAAENEIKNLRETFAHLSSDVKNQLSRLSYNREKINAQLEEIQRENDNLMGKHSKHSAQLREESINFPDNVEELQVLLLKTHEELISAKIAKEAKEEQETNLKCEIQLLRDQLNSELSEKNAKESELALQNSEIRQLLNATEKENQKLKNYVEKINMSDKDQKEQIKALKTQAAKLIKENTTCEENILMLQSRVGSLQQQLDTSEVVQKDFVRLSQSLQIELEKIRGADTEVRWQHEDDVDDCPGCKTSFSTGKKKDHCRHCGQILCGSCLSHTVVSGPRKRQARVCQVCHTLLNREIAPYFSQEPPHTPD